jgi:type II secretory pathway pseudopilin PulG
METLDGRKNRGNGFILIDVLVALVIAGVSFVVIFGNIAVAARQAAKTGDKLRTLITTRNEAVEQRHVTFTTR